MMPGLRMMSLKTKMALAVTSLFILFVIAASYFILAYFERSLKETITAQQFSLVTSLADNIDDKLSIAHNSLKAVAAIAPADAFTNPDSAQRFLDNKSGLRSIFDNGIFFINKDGRLIVESPYRPNRRGKDLSFREWVQKTITRQKPYISEPYISTHTPGLPAIVMTVPVFDKRGNMTGMMTGSLSLLGENLLADLSKLKIGKTGYVFVADMNRILVVHPDRDRIMKPAAAPGINKVVDQAFMGFEGSGETVTSYGVPMIISIKHLRTASWFLGANYPIAEAYAPLEQARRYFVIIGGPATALLLLITWLIMRRLMAPLVAMTHHVEHLSNKPEEERLLELDAMDEIGVLAREFNYMVHVMDLDRESLREQKERIENERSFLETLINAIPDVVFVKDKNSVYVGCNDAFASLLMGLPKEEVKGRTDFDFIATSEFAEFFRQKDQETMASGELVKYELWHNSVDGKRIMVETLKVPFRDALGNVAGIIGISRNITERKLTEEKLHQQAEQLASEVAERQSAQDALAIKQFQLEQLNQLLEERVFKTVNELRQKDQLLIQQSRQAAMGEMIGNIAHQWRQPLNTLGLTIQQLLLFYDVGEFSREFLKQNIDSSMELIQHMSRTIDDFRNYFRPDKEKTEFNVHEVIVNTLSLLEGCFQRPKISIEVIAKEDTIIHGFRNEFAQVLLNILTNARDVLIERKIDVPCVKITLCSEGGHTIVTIADNAGGIPEAIMCKIFDPYFTTKGPQSGTGVGLFMSKTIIEKNMGGKLNVLNIANGAEFRIEV
jgi:PAS domain S-box-containing protein